MHVGMTTFFQNLTPGVCDREVYKHELSMADLAEPLGFDSVWSAEHHFTGYTMAPNVMQFLTYMAGRTSRVKLGSMVVVLPWHDPIRVAEEISVVDHMSNGRVILGIGRGLGRVEFDAFRLEMGESRERFIEYSEAILSALELGYIEYDGHLYRQPKARIRPQPFMSFQGRTYASAVSPESARIMARLGVGIMIIPQKPWAKTVAELEMYREIYAELHHGAQAPKPLLVTWVACHEDRAMAEEMHERYIRGYSRSALEHYEFHNEGLAKVKGYEYYGALAKNIKKHGIDEFVNFLADLQVWGTPDEVTERIIEYQKLTQCAGYIGAFSYGGMPADLAKRNIRTFAEKVMPTLKAYEVPGAAPALQVAA